jgi:hypothetical protein
MLFEAMMSFAHSGKNGSMAARECGSITFFTL